MSSPPPIKKGPTCFLDLPGELRNKIYELIMPYPTTFNFHVEADLYRPVPPNTLIEVGGIVGQEVASLWYGRNSFYFTYFRLCPSFLYSLSTERRGMVKRLGLVYRRNFTDLGQKFLARRFARDLRAMGKSFGKDVASDNVWIRLDNVRPPRKGAWIRLTDMPEIDVVEMRDEWGVAWKRGEGKWL